MLDALLPYIPTPEKTIAEDVPLIGVFKLQPFGPLVAVGVILGWKQCLRYAKHKDIDEYLFRDYLFWMLVAAFVISHWVSVIFYFPEQIEEDPFVLLYIWNGLSSVGGFFGAFIGMTWYLKKHKQPIMVYADATIFGLLLGWVFGRAGCSIVHDHPGARAAAGEDPNFLMVGPWPCPCPGGAAASAECCAAPVWQYDLGLLEFFFALTLCLTIYFFVDWKNKKPGWLVGVVATSYAPFRFGLDFLRAADVRYFGLTTAQYFTIAFAFVGIWLLFLRKQRDSDLAYAKNSERIKREQEERAKEDAEDDDDDDDDDEPPKSVSKVAQPKITAPKVESPGAKAAQAAAVDEGDDEESEDAVAPASKDVTPASKDDAELASSEPASKKASDAASADDD
jgi:phosphatidylglycerol:prolipoprotein diacylglycerol transferase